MRKNTSRQVPALPNSPANRLNTQATARDSITNLRLGSVESIDSGANQKCDVTILMPCLNEAETLRNCIRVAQRAIEELGVSGEVLIADNGSTDGSVQIALEEGARVVHVKQRGYGSALMGGIEAARGEFILMGDADESYDFSHLGRFVEKLKEGNDLVMGNRFLGGIEPGAMPPLHQYLGNPGLTWIGKLFFNCKSNDFYCGLRGFRRDAIRNLNLATTGMEFASEMVVKSTIFGLRVAEVPTTLKPDGRTHAPHLRTWSDGWKGLRFLLMYSPRWLFLYPGALLMLLGASISAWLLGGPRHIGRVTFDLHTLLYAGMAIILGFQCINFAAFTKIFTIAEGLLPEDSRIAKLFKLITLERGLIIGTALFLAGIAISIGAVADWRSVNFGSLDFDKTMRLVIPSFVLCTLGFQIVLSSFFMSILGMSRRK